MARRHALRRHAARIFGEEARGEKGAARRRAAWREEVRAGGVVAAEDARISAEEYGSRKRGAGDIYIDP